MTIFLLFIVFLFVYKLKINDNESYLSLKQTTCINGIFIMFVFFRHISQYTTFDCFVDKPMLILDKCLGQLIVAMFLFNSGYGILESIKNKNNYINTIPKKRILNTLIKFDICIVVYYFINCLIGNHIEYKKLILSFLGFESIGNSNWYILSILILWICTFISFKISKNSIKKGIIFSFCFSLIYIIIMKQVGYPNYYYNTLFCYIYGMIFSYNYEKITHLISKRKNWFVLMVLNLVFLFVSAMLIKRNNNNILVYEVMSLFFVNILILVLKKIKIDNKFALYFGKNLFSLYLLQRIPMIIFKQVGLANYNAYLYFIVCFIATILIGNIFNKITKKIKI